VSCASKVTGWRWPTAWNIRLDAWVGFAGEGARPASAERPTRGRRRYGDASSGDIEDVSVAPRRSSRHILSMRRSLLVRFTYQGVCTALFLCSLMLLGSCETKVEVVPGARRTSLSGASRRGRGAQGSRQVPMKPPPGFSSQVLAQPLPPQRSSHTKEDRHSQVGAMAHAAGIALQA
jgi:hypothetical protein